MFIIFIFSKSKFELCLSIITGRHIPSIYVPVKNSLLIHNVAGPEGNIHVDMIFHLILV